jgi:hypothetical protein
MYHCHKLLDLTYKMRLSATVGRWNSEMLRFCEEYGALVEDNPGVLNTIWFSDEALGWLHST